MPSAFRHMRPVLSSLSRMALTVLAVMGLSGCARAAVIEVSDQRGFEIAIAGLLAGDRVIVGDGYYTFPEVRGRGRADAPIIIEAQKAALDGGAAVIEGYADIKGEHVTIRGFLFEAREKTFEAIRIVKSGNVEISGNIIRHVETGYGVRVHASSDVLIKDNLFEGQFNHAISSKERVERMRVISNHFIDCGLGCVEAGQSPDGTIDAEQTSGLIEIRHNLFEGRDTGGGKTFRGVGIKVKNAEHTIIKDNRFTGRWTHPIQSSFGSTGPKAKNRLGHFGPRNPGLVEIIGNDFGKGGELDLAGRGIRDDLFVFRDNRGSVRCTLSGFRTHGGPIRKLLDHSTIVDAAPIARQSGDSFVCKAGES